jgi:hypothetical protein
LIPRALPEGSIFDHEGQPHLARERKPFLPSVEYYFLVQGESMAVEPHKRFHSENRVSLSRMGYFKGLNKYDDAH